MLPGSHRTCETYKALGSSLAAIRTRAQVLRMKRAHNIDVDGLIMHSGVYMTINRNVIIALCVHRQLLKGHWLVKVPLNGHVAVQRNRLVQLEF